MLTRNHEFHRRMIIRLDEEISRLTVEIANGQAEDYAAYKSKCGKIAGLRLALECAEEVSSDIEKIV